MNELKRKTLEELFEMSRKEQNAYLAKLPEQEAEKVAHAIFRAQADRNVKKMVDSLNSNAKKNPIPHRQARLS
jgi:hypothetical protein